MRPRVDHRSWPHICRLGNARQAADDVSCRRRGTEFFEAPFIQWEESEQLYALLYMGSGIRTINLPRFDLAFECDNSGESTVVSLMFSPRRRSVSYPSNPD